MGICQTREAGCGVHPLEKLSSAELSTVVGVTGEDYLTHLHLSWVPVHLPFLKNENRLFHQHGVSGLIRHHRALEYNIDYNEIYKSCQQW